MADLHLAMLDSQKGDILAVTIIRRDKDEDREMTLQVELTIPPIARPEP